MRKIKIFEDELGKYTKCKFCRGEILLIENEEPETVCVDCEHLDCKKKEG